MSSHKRHELPPGLSPRRRRSAAAVGLGVAAALSLAACGQSSTATGDLATGPQLLSTCHGKPVAAMVALDVSGSMDEERKSMAKRFFMLLYLFLTRSYEHIEVVFIRHHTVAKEVDEDEFFTSRESGGTVVSSALELMYTIIKDRYPSSQWNIYGAQASDGDNWNDDSPRCRELLEQSLLALTQYFAYIEITDGPPQNLWEEYTRLQTTHGDAFAMQRIATPAEIYPVFRELFKRRVQP